MSSILQHGGQAGCTGLHQIISDNHECHAAGAEILLSTGIDEPVASDVDGPTEDIAAGITHQKRSGRDICRLGAELRPENRVVRCVVNVDWSFTVLDLRWDVAVVGILAGAGDVSLAAGFGFLQAFSDHAPVTR